MKWYFSGKVIFQGEFSLSEGRHIFLQSLKLTELLQSLTYGF